MLASWRGSCYEDSITTTKRKYPGINLRRNGLALCKNYKAL